MTTITVLGSGCATCKNLFEQTKRAVDELNLGIEVEYSTDIQRLLALGLMSSPALVINDAPVLVGSVPDYIRLKDIVAKAVNANNEL